MALKQIKGLNNSFVLKIALILIAFTVLWGLGDFSKFNDDNYIAKVGDQKISVQEYRKAYEQFMRRYGSSFEGMTSEELKKFGFDKMVIGELVNGKLRDNFVADLGLVVSDDKIAELIRKNPEFGVNGVFDSNKFAKILENNALSEKAFTKLSKENIGKSILYNVIAKNFVPNNYLAEILYNYYFEKKYFDVFEVSASSTSQNPSDQELEAFYQESKSGYLEPEKREIKFAKIPLDQDSKSIKIEDGEIKDYYEINIEQFKKSASRDFIIFVFTSKEQVDKAAQQTKAELLANKDITHQEFKNIYLDNLQGKTKEMVFDTALDKSSAPFELENKWSVVIPTGKYEPKQVTLADASKEISKVLASGKQIKLFSELLNDIEDEITGGSNFNEIESKFNLKAQTSIISAEKSDFSKKLTEEIFNNTSKDTEIYSNGDEHFIYKVEQVIASKPQDLGDIKDRVTKDYLSKKNKEDLQEFAQILFKSLSDNGNKDLVNANLKYKIKPKFNLSLMRTDLIGDNQFPSMPGELIKEVSATNESAIIKEIEGKYYIVKIIKTEEPDGVNKDKLSFIENIQNEGASKIFDDEIQKYISTLYKVAINQP